MPTIRLHIIEEIKTMIEHTEEQTNSWRRSSLPTHCKIAYRQQQMITQIPVLIQLLHKLQYPHADIFNQELSNGFPLLGRLQPGLHWHVREDNKYKQPQTNQELWAYNRNYIHVNLKQRT